MQTYACMACLGADGNHVTGDLRWAATVLKAPVKQPAEDAQTAVCAQAGLRDSLVRVTDAESLVRMAARLGAAVQMPGLACRETMVSIYAPVTQPLAQRNNHQVLMPLYMQSCSTESFA